MWGEGKGKEGGDRQKCVSSQSGGWKSKIKVPASLVSSEALLLGLQMAAFSLCAHMVFLCAYTSLVSLRVSKDTSQIELEPTLGASFSVIIPLKDGFTDSFAQSLYASSTHALFFVWFGLAFFFFLTILHDLENFPDQRSEIKHVPAAVEAWSFSHWPKRKSECIVLHKVIILLSPLPLFKKLYT